MVTGIIHEAALQYMVQITIFLVIAPNYCFGHSGAHLWYGIIGFFKFLAGITDIADVVCLLFFLFIISFCFAFYNQTSDIEFAIYFMAGNKSLPLRVYESMSEVFLRQFLKNNIYFISKKYAVCKTLKPSMKTIFTETFFNWTSQYVTVVSSTLTNI